MYSLKDVSNLINASGSSHEYSQQRVSVLHSKLKVKLCSDCSCKSAEGKFRGGLLTLG